VVCSRNGYTEVSVDCTTVGFNNIVGNTCYVDFEEILPGMLSCYEGPGDPDPIKFQQQLILPSLQAPYQTADPPTESNTPLPTDPSIPENTKPPKPNGIIVEGQDDEGLSAGATVGIVFAILGLVFVAVIASILLIGRRKKLTEQRTRPVAKEEKVQPPEAPPPVAVGGNEESASLAPSTIQADCFWISPTTVTNDEEVQPPEAPPPVGDEEVQPPVGDNGSISLTLTIQADGSVIAEKTIPQLDGSTMIARAIYPDIATARADGYIV
jgi:hypothetical protein